MLTLLKMVRAMLAEYGWSLLELPAEAGLGSGLGPGPGLATTITAAGASWPLVILADEQERVLLCYSICPRTVPSDRRSAVAEVLTRINHGLLIGTFELDLDDGEVRLRTSQDVGHAPLTAHLVRSLVGRNIANAERHFPTVESAMTAPGQGQGAAEELRRP